MQYEKFKNILNKIFKESKADLIKKIGNSPERYIGLFTPTKPKLKIIQDLIQSHEIKFGDAFEVLIEAYLKEQHFEILEKRLQFENEFLHFDQHFKKDNTIFFVEQKIRDDHDSTKKRGQTHNFEKKIKLLLNQNSEKNVIGIMYFVDPDLTKNKNYYAQKIQELKKQYGIEIHLFYGKAFFDFFNLNWEEVLDYLKQWKKELPNLPEINFDKNPEKTFEELKKVSPQVFRKLFSNAHIFEDIIETLFPEKKVLHLLLAYFKEKSKETRYKNLHKLLKLKL